MIRSYREIIYCGIIVLIGTFSGMKTCIALGWSAKRVPSEIENFNSDIGSHYSSTATGYIGLLAPYIERERQGHILTPREWIRLCGVVHLWYDSEPDACIQFLKDNHRRSLLYSIHYFVKKSKRNERGFENQIAEALKIEDRDLQDAAILSNFEGLDEPENAISFVQWVPKHLQRKVRTQIGQQWLSKDPAEAIRHIYGDPGFSSGLISDIIAFGAKNSPDKIFQAIQELPDASCAGSGFSTKGRVLMGFIASLENTANALEYLRTTPNSRLRSSQLANYTLSLMAKRGGSSLEHGDMLKGLPYAGVAYIIESNQNPTEASALANLLPSDELRRDSLVRIAKSVAKSSPENALKTASSFPDPLALGIAAKDVFSDWLKKDSNAALKFASSSNSNNPEIIRVIDLVLIDRARTAEPAEYEKIAKILTLRRGSEVLGAISRVDQGRGGGEQKRGYGKPESTRSQK